MAIECRHGHLARKCQTCDLEQEITDLRTENASLRAELATRASMIADCGDEIRQLRAERDEARANYQFMVDRAADQRLDGYRELGAKCAALEAERDEARAVAVNVPVEDLARFFHEEYERLAPLHGYETRRESRVPWVQLGNRLLMIETVKAALVRAKAESEVERG